MIIIGVDGATWDVIKPNIEKLPTFKKLLKTSKHKTINLKQKPWSASIWCSMFSGIPPEEHKHFNFVKDGIIVKREDIKVEFIWDKMQKHGISVKALNVPFVVPPYNFNVNFTTPGEGVPITEDELLEEINLVTQKGIEILENNKPELSIICFTALDKLSHHHWGEKIIVDFYKKIDASISRLLRFDNEFIIISDHGFCDYEKAPIQTLPKKTKTGIELKGDHHPDAILITNDISFEINKPEDVFWGLAKKYRVI